MKKYCISGSAQPWRQSFLENVPDNRAIMKMWDRRGWSVQVY